MLSYMLNITGNTVAVILERQSNFRSSGEQRRTHGADRAGGAKVNGQLNRICTNLCARCRIKSRMIRHKYQAHFRHSAIRLACQNRIAEGLAADTDRPLLVSRSRTEYVMNRTLGAPVVAQSAADHLEHSTVTATQTG